MIAIFIFNIGVVYVYKMPIKSFVGIALEDI